MSWKRSLHKIDPPELQAIKSYIGQVTNDTYSINNVTKLLSPYTSDKNVPRDVRRLRQMQKEKELVRNLLSTNKTKNNSFLKQYKTHIGLSLLICSLKQIFCLLTTL